jgi:hypothetical protein
MKRGLAVSIAACAVVVAMSNARADVSVGAGVEGFHWKESTSPTVKESGLRWVLDLTWAQSKQPGISTEYNLKLYTGNVDYDGANLVTNTPLSGETHYRGVQNELRAVYRTQTGIDFVMAGGWDHWKRDLSASQEEGWDVLYARLGVAYNVPVKQGVIGSAGVKYPVYVREDGHFPDLGLGLLNNPRLRPSGDCSFYGTLGYRIQAWDIIAYYDSYRFKQSNTVAVTDGTSVFGFFQPKSREDVVGMKAQFNF